MDGYTFEVALRPRYRDLDPNGHVNQAVYATYFEEARTAYWQHVLDQPLADAGVALVSQSIEYRREVALGDELTAAVRIDEPGETSIPQAYELRSNDAVAAVGTAVMVAFDRERRSSHPIPEDWRTAIRRYERANGNAW